MEKYLIKYHFSKDFYVGRKYESKHPKDTALIMVSSDPRIEFEDSKGVYHSFLMADVKLLTIEIDKPKTVYSKHGGLSR